MTCLLVELKSSEEKEEGSNSGKTSAREQVSQVSILFTQQRTEMKLTPCA